MPSPFPGMDPYIEQDKVWHDFHIRFIPHIAELIAPQVRPAYTVRLEERLYIRELSDDERFLLGRADVGVVSPEQRDGGRSVATLQAPAHGRILPTKEVERYPYVEIRNRDDDQLVTVIELLSPSNKRSGEDRDQYLAKRKQLLVSTTHLVEIDLLRGWARLPLEDLPQCDYCVVVSRSEDRPIVDIWPMKLRDRLPLIPIPLRGSDQDARLDLQEAFQHVYEAAGYEDYIYKSRPRPPLHPDDERWARELVKQALK